MNTDYLAALRTGPFFLFPFNKIPDAEFSDVLQIVDHAHTILGSVPLIQVIQSAQGKFSQPEQYLTSAPATLSQFLIGHSTRVFGFGTVVTSASGTWITISHVCETKAAVHSAGSDERRTDRLCLSRLF